MTKLNVYLVLYIVSKMVVFTTVVVISSINCLTFCLFYRNQCIVISGESGSGKTESTNFLLHHLTSLSQKVFK